MNWDEVRVRTQQEIAKRWDLLMCTAGVDLVGRCAGAYSRPAGKFFFLPEDVPGIVTTLRERLPDAAEFIIQRAERICRHEFDLLGYEGLNYGAKIDWHFDAVHAKRAPRRPWFKVHYLDFNEVGDCKVVWELNRHQHLVILAKAYLLTGNVVFAEELFREWYQWHEHNPYGIGINWASSLEVAFRTLSWLWVEHLLSGSPVAPPRFAADLRRALLLNIRHIGQFLSTYFSPNTHLLGEAVALFAAGILLPGAERAQRDGWQIILQQAQRQVLADGMHFEQSTYYHVYALDFFLHSRILADINGVRIPAALDESIINMLQVLRTLGQGGQLPRFGDDDGGRVFDPQRNRPEHLLDPLATGAVLYNRGDFKQAVDGICEETLWLLGADAFSRFDELGSTKPQQNAAVLEASGTCVLSSSDPVPQRLVIDAGPHGFGRAGHGHADALSIQFWVGQQPILIDPGTFTYARQDERDQFRETASHNTVQIDGMNQAEPDGLFAWKKLPIVSIDKWIAGSSFVFFSGSHNSYEHLKSPVTHRRYVVHVKPSFWLIRDVLEGRGSHKVDVAWHFAAGSIATLPDGATFAGDNASATLLFAAPSSQRWSQHICPAWQSPVYGRKEPSSILRCSADVELPTEIATLLVPSTTEIGTFQRLHNHRAKGQVQAYECNQDAATHYIFFADEPGAWEFDSWASDTSFAFCSLSSSGSLSQLIACDSSYFAHHGQRLFHSDAPAAAFEWTAETEELSPPALLQEIPDPTLSVCG